MKQSKLQTSEYILLLTGFTEWLQLLGYSVLSIPGLAKSTEHFLAYQEQNNRVLHQLQAIHASEFITLLTTQTGQRTGKPFSHAHINKQVQSLMLFSRYIRQTGRNETGFAIPLMETEKTKPVWLTKTEMQLLHDACSPPSGELEGAVLGIRDKAMLAVYYGCGLRLNEGSNIELKDIDHTRKILYVRKGKGYKERYVPIAEKNYEEIKLYMDYARPQLLQAIKTEAFFIGANKGIKMDKQSLYIRIKRLVKKARINKKVGTHTLRHSIATHLLQSGMKLERIKDFLGHSHLDSTQIYTHLAPPPPEGGI
jgi:site-specific recombinase XerD